MHDTYSSHTEREEEAGWEEGKKKRKQWKGEVTDTSGVCLEGVKQGPEEWCAP